MRVVGRKYGAVLPVVVAFAAAAGCGSSSSSSAAASGSSGSTSTSSTPNVGRLPTAKFVLHAGLAFSAFHRYIYKPFKAGDFSGGLFKHKLTSVKAALAGLFVYRELKLAVTDAQASPKLSKLLAPVTTLADKIKSIGSSVKSGKPDAASLSSANGDITSVSGLASAAGVPVRDQVPSAAQLASGGTS